MSMSLAIFFALWLLTSVFWLNELIRLMSRPAAAFPGKHDKLMWFGLLLFFNFFGAVTFWLWTRSHDSQPTGANV